ncbi:hypothetical protein FPV67DRAFT_1472713 [Lyophyllum atratum]|nr:hypothetical protein FPV67DRAFT_1472713 [Lyophyllum atratum]
MTLILRSLFNSTRRILLSLPPRFNGQLCHARPLAYQRLPRNDYGPGKTERGRLKSFISNLYNVIHTEQDPSSIDKYIHRRLDRLLANTTAPDVVYGKLISFLVEHFRFKDATSVYERMLAGGVIPPMQTQAEMTAVALALSESDTEVQRALEAIALDPEYTEAKLLHLFDVLGRLGVSNDHILRVVAVFTETRGEEYTPSSTLLTKLVDVQTRAGQLDDAFRTVADSGRKKPSRSAPYATIMKALNQTSSSDWGAFQKVLEKMKVQDVDPDINIFNTLISRELRQKSLESAFSLYRVVVELSKTTTTSPNAATFAPLFKLLAKVYQADARTARLRAHRDSDIIIPPRQLFRDMLDFHDAPNMITYSLAMRHLVNRVRIDTRMGRKVGAWRWGERFMGLTSIHGIRKLKVDDDFADKEFELAGHLFAYLREPMVETKYRVPTRSMRRVCSSPVVPLRRIFRRAAFAALDISDEGTAPAELRMAIEKAKREMLPRAEDTDAND